MNSDPHESAAWRIFGLLDADEAAAFDDAMRDDAELRNAYREIECLTAAIAATTTISVAPRPGQFERLQLKLGLNTSKNTNWLGISGWAAAAALTMVLIFQRNPEARTTVVQNTRNILTTPPQVPSPNELIQSPAPSISGGIQPPPKDPRDTSLANTTSSPENKIIVQVETQRLVHEIEVLREKLVTIQQQDRQRFEPVPGMVWPIVMRMTPPQLDTAKTGSLTLEKESPEITTILGDALAAVASGNIPLDAGSRNGESSAIQIYDPATDAGTLVVSNLPDAADDEEFSLFVSRKAGEKPILVGRLPQTKMGRSKSFDYALGANATVPAAFTLIKSKKGIVAEPTTKNTVLRGPQ